MMINDLISHSMKSRELFDSLKNRKLLDWNLVRHKYCTIKHIDALKWIERNEIDVVNKDEHFEKFVKHSTAEIMEYLIVEKGMTVEYMSRNISFARQDVLKMVYRLQGIEGIQKMDPRKFLSIFQSVKFLKSIGYKFNEHIKFNSWIYTLVCLKVIKYEDLNKEEKRKFGKYVKEHDIKVCKHLYPSMKEIRKKKIMTVILCMRNLYPFFQKEIIWNILDLAYSPINERGSI